MQQFSRRGVWEACACEDQRTESGNRIARCHPVSSAQGSDCSHIQSPLLSHLIRFTSTYQYRFVQICWCIHRRHMPISPILIPVRLASLLRYLLRYAHLCPLPWQYRPPAYRLLHDACHLQRLHGRAPLPCCEARNAAGQQVCEGAPGHALRCMHLLVCAQPRSSSPRSPAASSSCFICDRYRIA